jgi:hypothetical protein
MTQLLTDQDQATIASLRRRGFAITILAPQEIPEETDAIELEGVMYEAAEDWIEERTKP